MNEETRRAIVHAAVARIAKRPANSIYSYEAGRYSNFTTDASGGGYDYDASAHIAASSSGLYLYGQSAHVNLSISGRQFRGYDYGSGNHFSGHVSGRTVQIYDYGEGRYFNYTA